MNIHVTKLTCRTTTTICKQFQPALARWTSSRFSASINTGRTSSFQFKLAQGQTLAQKRQSSSWRQFDYKSISYNLASKAIFNRSFGSTPQNKAMDLKSVVSLLEEFAPTSLAGSWDNVGLLVEPSPPHTVSTICLTNDLTEEVLAEAFEKQTDLILSYHPPIFTPLKRLTMRNEKERIIIRAVEKRIAIYSPHTAYDAVEGGVNDWLVVGLGDTILNKPLEPSLDVTKGDDFNITVMTSSPDKAIIIHGMPGAHAVTCIPTVNSIFQVTCSCRKSDLGKVISSVRGLEGVDEGSLKITPLAKAPIARTGVGRMAKLRFPASIETMIKRIKTHLNLDLVQIALGEGKTPESDISTVGICAGSGASVLKGVKADMFLTGEMSHHDILAAVAVGTTVVVCNHSNTERGYLHVLQGKLTEMFENKVLVFVSEVDRDPLQYV